ncbi:MAG: 5'/3'-nucleotidase SurE, partial [Actinomycetota bacterium]
MTSRPIDLSNPRILVTNDDGIHAPGLEVLERIAADIGGEIWVVAP